VVWPGSGVAAQRSLLGLIAPIEAIALIKPCH